jgi:POT family proton-dependent oligopeptide transporter
MFNQSQPQGFTIFFLTEMWERYGFYVLQTLLVFYAIEKIHLNDTATYTLVGSFTALAYVNSIFGGLIADRFIGYDKAIMGGAILLCLGYLILTLATHADWFILGLAIVTVGTGMLKPNISSMLSMLYKSQPERKDQGYTLFYVGIYFGAIGGSFVGGFIQDYFGWLAVFGSATIGMLISLFTFLWGQHHYKLKDERQIHLTSARLAKALCSLVGLIAIAYCGLNSATLSAGLFIVIGSLSVVYLGYTITQHHGIERKKLMAFSLLTLFSVFYWAVYFQQFFSVSLCTARVTKLSLPESSLTAFESLGVIIFGPLVNSLSLYLSNRRGDFSLPVKFSLSFLFNSLSFLVLILSLQYALSHGQMQQQIFIIFSYLLIAIGELFIAPIGLSMVSTLVPQRLNGAMMGIFLMSIGLGGKLAGLLAQSAASTATQSIHQLEIIYRNSFSTYCGFSLLVFILCIISTKAINQLIKGA